MRTHWSRVFREAFRDAPRAAFTLHAGDLIDKPNWDAEWGDWHQGPDWVNGTIPVIATLVTMNIIVLIKVLNQSVIGRQKMERL